MSAPSAERFADVGRRAMHAPTAFGHEALQDTKTSKPPASLQAGGPRFARRPKAGVPPDLADSVFFVSLVFLEIFEPSRGRVHRY